MNHIYLFSGLGVDHRAYQHIDLRGIEHTFIQWIHPHMQESITAYAGRIASQITATNFILIGVSFGGMVAIEVAKFKKPKKIIIISSAKTRNEIPAPFRLLGRWLPVHKLIPAALIKKTNRVTFWLFGTHRNQSKNILQAIIADTDPNFFRWAITEICCWNNTTAPNNITHIHGTADRILPYMFVKCNVTITNGGHFMLVDKGEEITAIIRKILLEN